MPLHLLKLSVGAESISDLEAWIAEKLAARRRAKEPVEHFHTTRMVPKRVGELLDGGSMYWVIRGQVAGRQVLRDVRPFTDKEGIGRCHLVLDLPVIPVMPRPCRPFQGWRYLSDADCPTDLDRAGGQIGEMPEGLRRELRELGLI